MGRMNSDQMGGLWKEISAQPSDIIMEVAARASLKDYGEEEFTMKRDLGQSVGVVTPTRKIKRGTRKDWEERVESEKSGIERGEIPQGDYTRVTVEVWNIRARGSWIIQENSALYLMMEGILIWWNINTTRILIKYLNITSSEWRGKFKGFRNIRLDKVIRIYTSEGEMIIVYYRMVDGIKEDEDMVAGRDCIHRAMQCKWWVWKEGLRCLFWRRTR